MNDSEPLLLIVDDDLDLVDALADILARRGYRVVTATSGEQALSRLAEGTHPALILFDLMMPGMNGWSFRQKLLERPEYEDIPAVVLSGDHTVLRDAAPPRCFKLLRKPVDLGTLLDTVKQGCTASLGP